MRVIDLNQSELDLLRELLDQKDVPSVTVEDWKRVRYERRLEFCDLMSNFYGTSLKERERYLIQLPDKEANIKLEESRTQDQLERKARLKDSAKAILGMDQETWDKLPDGTQREVLEGFELIREAGQEISRKEIDSRTPEEIRTILSASNDEWRELPESVTDAVVEKFEQLAG